MPGQGEIELAQENNGLHYHQLQPAQTAHEKQKSMLLQKFQLNSQIAR